ncbi:hypothetical protein FB460_0927 [Propioniferax innocua]|uniref:Uncharacterized protein n=1 Tax=Propioniferax innocua TaxID=1753 RepID=A0A542ZS59_9ACTN|nr:hypothetical protein FB460_0927 [Propioniferax innocua]
MSVWQLDYTRACEKSLTLLATALRISNCHRFAEVDHSVEVWCVG